MNSAKSTHVVTWIQKTDERDIPRFRSFSTARERDIFIGVLSVDLSVYGISSNGEVDRNIYPWSRAKPIWYVIEIPSAGAFRRCLKAVAAALALSIGLSACASMSGAVPSTGATLTAYQQTMPPVGFIGFCLRNPDSDECSGGTDHPRVVTLTPHHWAEIAEVDAWGNSLPQFPDTSPPELWKDASGQGGDCEDISIAKRRALIKRGWPSDALALATVTRWNGDHHAVLIVNTTRGEYVLDNLSPMVRSVDDAPYIWNKRQSYSRPFEWVNLDLSTAIEIPSKKTAPIGRAPFVTAQVSK